MGRRSSKKRKKSRSKKGSIRRLAISLLIIILCISVLEVVFVRFFSPPIVLSDGIKWLWYKVKGEEFLIPQYKWCPISEISPYIKKAVLAGEDQRFLHHWGFDAEEIKASVFNFIKGKPLRGASTITMQTARTIFLWKGRSYLRKFMEIYYAILMELILTKRRIFELYLNTVDWGDGIRGVESASMRYFGIHCWQLSKEQSVKLASVLPSPHRWSPLGQNRALRDRQKRIFQAMDLMPSL